MSSAPSNRVQLPQMCVCREKERKRGERQNEREREKGRGKEGEGKRQREEEKRGGGERASMPWPRVRDSLKASRHHMTLTVGALTKGPSAGAVPQLCLRLPASKAVFYSGHLSGAAAGGHGRPPQRLPQVAYCFLKSMRFVRPYIGTDERNVLHSAG